MVIIIHFKFFKDHKNFTVQLLFVIIAFLFILYPLKTGTIFSSDDSVFNLQKLHEIFESILHLHLPQFSSYSAYPMGMATPTMYPWLILALFTPLTLLLKPVEVWYVILFVGMFIGLNIAYFSFKYVMNIRKAGAFLFAVMYCVSCSVMGWIYYNSDLGIYFAIAFAPIAFFGWLHFQHTNHWKMMVIGLLLMSCCHILATIVMLITIMLATICTRTQFNKYCIKNGLIAFATFIITDAIIWLPIFVILITNHINEPDTMWVSSSNLLFVSINRLLTPYNMRGWCYLDIVAIVFFFGYWHEFSVTMRSLFGIAIFYILLNSDVLWMFLFNNTPMKWLQYSFRFDFVIDLIMMSILSIIVVKYLPKQKWWINERVISFMMLLLLIVGVGVGVSQCEIFHSFRNERRENRFDLAVNHSYKNQKLPLVTDRNLLHNPYLYHDKVCSDYFPYGYANSYMRWNARSKKKIPKYIEYSTNTPNSIHNNQKLTENAVNHNSYSSTARVIKSSSNVRIIKLITHRALEAHYINNGVKVYVPHNHMKVLLPIGLYNAQKYNITNNGHKCHWRDYHHGILEIDHLNKGTHKIRYSIPIMWYRYLSLSLTLLGLCALILVRKE